MGNRGEGLLLSSPEMKAAKVDAMLLFGSPPTPSPWCVQMKENGLT